MNGIPICLLVKAYMAGDTKDLKVIRVIVVMVEVEMVKAEIFLTTAFGTRFLAFNIPIWPAILAPFPKIVLLAPYF